MANSETMPVGTRSLLETCYTQFIYYRDVHNAKGTYESGLKAKENQRFADMIRKHLDG